MHSFSDIVEYESFASSQVLEKRRDKDLLKRFVFGSGDGEYPLGKGWAWRLQLDYSDLIYSVFELFCNEIGDSRLKEVFRCKISHSLTSGSLSSVRDAWRNLIGELDTCPIDPHLGNDPQGCVELFFRYGLDSPLRIPVYSDSDAVDSELAAHGLSPAFARLCLRQIHEIDPEWAKLIQSHIDNSLKLKTVLQAESECAWIYRAALSGCIDLVDPYTGEMVSSADSLVAYGRGIYRFIGFAGKTFFLITGGPWNAAAGLYLPHENIAVIFNKSFSGLFLGKPLANLLTAFFRKRIGKAASIPHPQPNTEEARPVVIYVPPTDNFAHHIWNYNSFLHRVSNSSARDNVQSVAYSGSEFFGALAKIHPGIALEKWVRPRRQNVVSSDDFLGSPIVIPAGGYFMHPDLIESCVRLASLSPKVLPCCVEPADIVDLAGKIVVWVSLRTRGRAWTPQVESVAEVINIVSGLHKDVMFVLDGFSLPVGVDEISHKWRNSLLELDNMANAIIGLCDANVLSLVGNSFRESLLWARVSHLYVAPYGSSQHKIAWFSPAKGLMYVPNTIKERQVMRSAGLCASPVSSHPDVLYCPPAGMNSLDHGPMRTFAVSNYDVTLDPGLVAGWLDRSILEIRRSSIVGY